MKRIITFKVFFLLLCFSTLAQKDKDIFKIKQTYTVNLANTDSSVRAEVFYDHREFKPHIEYTYYWFYINKILSTKGGFDGRLLHGTYTCYYANNNMHQRGEFDKGLKTGTWYNWSADGKMKEESRWKNSQRNGKMKTFGPDGELLTVTNYKNDKVNGLVITYDKDGKISSKKKFKNNKELDKKSTKLPHLNFSFVKKLFTKKDKKASETVSPKENKEEPSAKEKEKATENKEPKKSGKKLLNPLKRGDKTKTTPEESEKVRK